MLSPYQMPSHVEKIVDRSMSSQEYLSQEIFDIAVTEVEAIVEPDSVADDIGRETVSFVGIHPEIIHFRELSCQYHSVS
jgi:hypothetical protein